jgi:hypothetical protein
MVTCAELTAYWDQAIGRFLVGGPAVPPDPRGQLWAQAYRGRGRGEVAREALPEPYLGALDRLGVGGWSYPTEVSSRAVLVLWGEDGPVVIAERHRGGAGPPRRSETGVLREALEPWLSEP